MISNKFPERPTGSHGTRMINLLSTHLTYVYIYIYIYNLAITVSAGTIMVAELHTFSTKFHWLWVIPSYLFDQMTSLKMADEISGNLMVLRVLIVDTYTSLVMAMSRGVAIRHWFVTCVAWQNDGDWSCPENLDFFYKVGENGGN